MLTIVKDKRLWYNISKIKYLNGRGKGNMDSEMTKNTIADTQDSNSLNSTSIEETCVADADILAHFDNIPMLFSYAFVVKKMNLQDARKYLKQRLEKDYNDLSERTRKEIEDRYENIVNVLNIKD